MRKAGKKQIVAAMKQYEKWHDAFAPRVESLENADARKYITEWMREVRTRIQAGELGHCTTALAESVRRDIEAWESGLFSRVDATGARVYA